MIGSFERAKDLLLCSIMEMEPETLGFQFVGGGAYRNAYLDERNGNVVYKVDKNILEGKKYSGYNYSEWVGVVKWQGSFPMPLCDNRIARIAESQLFDFGRACIMAQEYVPHPSSYYPLQYEDYRPLQNWYGVDDFHQGNYRCDYDGNIVIVDMGFNDSGFADDKWVVCSECGNGHYAKKKYPEAKEAAIEWADVIRAWH